jgi:hypothetical protein
MSAKPFPDSYWVIPGSFLAGAYPALSLDQAAIHGNLAAFLEIGIDTFFDLTRPDELQPYLPILQEEAARYGIPIHYQRTSIQDRNLPAIQQMAALLDDIDAALAAGRKVYLHCWGGIGRTGVTVGCWLVRHGMTGGQAFIHLNELYQTSGQSLLYPQSPETDAQVEFILGWSEDGLA